MKIGVMYGNPETTSGGHALKFFSSQRLEVRKGEKIMEGKEQIGYNIKIKVAKNKIAPPFKKAELPVKRNVGYDKTADIIEAGLLLKSIERNGAYYSVGDHKVQGKASLIGALEEDKKLSDQLEQQIQTAIKKMRMGEQVLDEDAIDSLETGTMDDE
jgi:recombination protein RecA